MSSINNSSFSDNVDNVSVIARGHDNSTTVNSDNTSTSSKLKTTTVSILSTTTSILSAAATQTIGAGPGAGPGAESDKKEGSIKNSNSSTNNNSKVYPIACTVCGIIFVCAVYFYIFHLGKKSKNTNDFVNDKYKDDYFLNNNGGGMKNNSSNNYTINIQTPEKSYNHSSQSRSNNLSSQNTSALKSADTTYLNMSSDNNLNTSFGKSNSGYSETHNLLEVNRNNLNFMNGTLNNNPGKPSTPNPIFGPYKYVPKKQIQKSNESDITDEYPQNLNILTQEETKLLKMKKNINTFNNMNMAMKMNTGMNMNMDLYSNEYESMKPTYYSLERLQNKNKNGTEAMNMNDYMMDENVNNNINYDNNNNNNKKYSGHRRSMSTPDLTAVAPFNYINYDNKNKNEIFKSNSRDSFYDDTFIRNLGSNVKIETKKIEYVDSEDSPINKIKIKRLNN